MDDNFFEEEGEGIFGEDEAFDYMMLDRMETEVGKQKGTGCLTSIVLIISIFSNDSSVKGMNDFISGISTSTLLNCKSISF